MITSPPSPELTASKFDPGRVVPKLPIKSLKHVNPLDLLVARKRGPQKASEAEAKGRKRSRKLVNYRWSQQTHTALKNEADRLGVSASALAEAIMVMALKSDDMRRTLEEMVELGH